MAVDPEFRRAVDQNYAALQSLIDGDPAPILAVWSHADDVTSFLGYGGYEQGWEQVRQRFEQVARHLGGGGRYWGRYWLVTSASQGGRLLSEPASSIRL